MPEPLLPNADPELSSKIDVQDLGRSGDSSSPSMASLPEARDEGLSQSDRSAERTAWGSGTPHSRVERSPHSDARQPEPDRTLVVTDGPSDEFVEPSGVERSAHRELAVFRHRRHLDAGLASYVAGLLTAAVVMALSLGPGWLGFLAGFLSMSLLTSWAVDSYA